jgi:hypothetical protein
MSQEIIRPWCEWWVVANALAYNTAVSIGQHILDTSAGKQ